LTAAVDVMRNTTPPHKMGNHQDDSPAMLHHTPIAPSLSVSQPETSTIVNRVPIHADATTHGDYNPSSNHSPVSWPAEPVNANGFTEEAKSRLLQTFVEKMLPQYPVISMPQGVPLQELETARPFTMQAVIASACCVSEPQSFKAMHDRSVVMLSDAVVVQGRKNLDLLQALLVTATWACPPDNLSNLNVYQWSHMACTMAMELGLGGRSSRHAQVQDVQELASNASEALMERFRTMFGVYLTCSR
jgi:hypothetical protein